MTIGHNDKKLLDIITANFMPENKAESDSAQEKRVKQILKKIVVRKNRENICAEQILLIYRKTFAIDCMSDWLLGTELDASC